MNNKKLSGFIIKKSMCMHGEQQMLYHDQYQNVLFCEFTHDVE